MPETRSNDTQEPGAAPAPPATLATTTKAAPAAAAERQSNQSLRYNSVNQVRVKQTRDQVFDFDVYGAYLQTIIKSIDSLNLIPAYRGHIIRGNFTNGLTGQQYAINDNGTIGQPKISTVYSVPAGYSLYATWGRTFQAGVRAGAYKIPPRTTDLVPSINDGWELGLKLNPGSWLEGRVAYWEQLASHEVRRKLNDPPGDSDILGKTRRHGVDVQANLRPHSQFNVWLSYSYQMAKIVDPGPADAATRRRA
ncbi:TonB-dependent receptor [Cupriavidus sp. CV2]|uniref:TonB-dependent receptor domain-containing protein n=1 Tax=Cupriavidus ulmosensis TaxID=3065913 RepID=UPI00296AE7C7|nr:TonB-dependent receptor [Cupriavidus sp. CV2]MDW3687806.1 TonB-dependent receptor [Cupriavidus sp. CV2]